MRREPRLYHAAAAADAKGVLAAPAALLAEPDAQGVRILAIGAIDEVSHHPAAAKLTPHHLGEVVLIPGLVNCHTHLDLTHVGPRDFDPNAEFRIWLDMVLAERRQDAQGIADSVALGVARSESGGVTAIADIAGIARREAVEALRNSAMVGVSFLEFFGMGQRQEASIASMRSVVESSAPHPRIRLGIQPHAPYSAGLRVFKATAEISRALGVPVSTHLAESIAEREFITLGTGPMRGLIERLGIWDDSILDEVGHGRTPTQHLSPSLAIAPFLVAHCNDCSDSDIDLLARTGTTLAYCPRSSEYFGHHLRFGPHRFRDMMNAGVRVVLGTDSIINTPPEHEDRLTPLDDARLLRSRDSMDPRTLIRMMTTDAATALGLAPEAFEFPRGGGGVVSGVACVEVTGTDAMLPPLERVMSARRGAPLLFRVIDAA